MMKVGLGLVVWFRIKRERRLNNLVVSTRRTLIPTRAVTVVKVAIERIARTPLQSLGNASGVSQMSSLMVFLPSAARKSSGYLDAGRLRWCCRPEHAAQQRVINGDVGRVGAREWAINRAVFDTSRVRCDSRGNQLAEGGA
jgi:hypothetical protein